MRTVVLGCLLLGLNVAALNAQNPARVAGGFGSVAIHRGGAWIAASPDQFVADGEKLRTGAGSFVTLELSAGTLVTLGNVTEIEMRENRLSLTAGVLKAFAPGNLSISTPKGSVEGVQYPVELELTVTRDITEISVGSGSVRTGSVILRASTESMYSTYTAGRSRPGPVNSVAYPNFYVWPQISFPGYPLQIVPPMTDPLRPPVHYPNGVRFRPRR